MPAENTPLFKLPQKGKRQKNKPVSQTATSARESKYPLFKMPQKDKRQKNKPAFHIRHVSARIKVSPFFKLSQEGKNKGAYFHSNHKERYEKP